MRKSIFGAAATVAAIASATPAEAMNWCGLLQVVPRDQADFDKLAPMVETFTGCARQASDSAHIADWTCADDPATADKYEGVHIRLVREPGKSVHLVVLASGLKNLDMLRTCGSSAKLRDGNRFSAGNVALRDRVYLGTLAPRLTLTAISPKIMSAIISDNQAYGEDSLVEGYWAGLHGVRVESSPYTSVKLAGLDPVSSDVRSIVAAFRARGSDVRRGDDGDEIFPTWKLSSPTGLAGVVEVNVKGFVNHVHDVEYVMGSTADYQRYIALLDDEYGTSKRSAEDGCTYRWWTSGRVSIRGEHCSGAGDRLTFFNDVALDQLEGVAEKLKADQAKPDSSPIKATIDRDML